MRRFRVPTIVAAGVLAACVSAPAQAAPTRAQAETVLVLDNGKIERKRERFLGPDELPGRATPPARARAAASKPPKGQVTRQTLESMIAAGQIDQPTFDARVTSLDAILSAYRNTTGRRHLELGAVIDNTDAMASDAQLTPSRLNAVFATIDANKTWWTTGALLKNGQRVSLKGSQIIWQYYSGQGIQLQMLANFGKANGLWQSKRTNTLRKLVGELMPLAADRGYPAFEYYFHFGGGEPPWTSSISQGTAVEALARAGQMLADPNLIQFGEAMLGAFETPPPQGVRKDTSTGPFYLIYTYAPDLLVINAHLQAVIGLYDYSQIAGSARGQALFQQGDQEAQAVLPTYDTGAWSLYDQSRESDLNYHDLVTTFLDGLCKRLTTPLYCDTAARFKADRRASPSAYPTTRRIRAGKPAKLGFAVNKISRVGVVVVQGERAVYSTSAVVGHGSRFYTWSRPATPGTYTVRVSATDLAGNVSSPREQQLQILPPKPKRTRR